ncbi:TonB-dependent receptor plug domain-containing protein [Aurantiacibacter flavus]|uniref:TonB-dependent receptor plug domain-containing protein n=1 Tax=Aurantiacibacter flavus TaxID=3145232 RepID=A0ABV0D0Q1_9SPHN
MFSPVVMGEGRITRLRRGAVGASAAALALGFTPWSAPVFAQADGASEDVAPAPPAEGAAREVFTPADFASFAPRSALDMLERVPGFAIDDRGGGQGRGLGQASGNVLLNGERLASKSDSITDQLARIPAGNVIRIEIVDGAALDVPGLTGRVANIVANSTGGVQVQFEWRPQLAAEYSKNRWLEGVISASGTFGALDVTVAAEGKPFYGGSGGTNYVTFASGRVEERFSTGLEQGDDTKYSTSLRYGLPGGAVANINASLLLRRFREWERERTLSPDVAPLYEEIFSLSRGYDYEVGGDLEFALAGGRLTLIGLERYDRLTFRSQSEVDPATGVPVTGILFSRFTESGERIGRAEYDWAMLDGDWQLSGEAAFNRLDRTSDLFTLEPDGTFTPLDFPAGTGGVTEDRYSASISHSRALTPTVSMQLIVGGEYSRIQQTGSGALARSFRRPNGSLSLSWSASERLNVSLKIERRTGQLDFADVLAEVNLADDNQNAANNELRPDQRWAYDLEAARDFGPWGNATLRIFQRDFSDYTTFVPTPTGGSARGNIETARIQGVELYGTVRFEPVGFTGARLDYSLNLRESSYTDPVLGGALPVGFAEPFELELDWRHDIPVTDWAWGAALRRTRFNPSYRVAEYGYDHRIGNALALFVEHKDLLGLTVQAKMSNLLQDELVYDRYVFDGPRGADNLLFRENRRREIGRVMEFIVKGSF